MLEEEKRLKESLQYMKDNGLTLQGYKLDSGRLRDVIASIMNTTGTKIAQIESINKHLIPEFSAELKEGRLTFSAAYEISGMAEDKQMELLEKYKEGGLSLKEVKQTKKEIEIISPMSMFCISCAVHTPMYFPMRSTATVWICSHKTVLTRPVDRIVQCVGSSFFGCVVKYTTSSV